MTKKPEWQVAHEKSQKQRDREFAKEICKTVRDKRGTDDFRAKLPFDGLMGTPPEWTPGTLPSEFVIARDRLLGEYSHKEILEFMDAKESSSKNLNFHRASFYPHEYTNDLETLIYVRHLSRLGKREGLHAYMNEPARMEYESIALSDAGKKAKGKVKKKEKPPYHKLLEVLQAPNWLYLLKILKVDEEARANYTEEGTIYRKRKLIKIRVQKIDEDAGIVTFCDLNGRALPPTHIKTLKNNIPKYRKK